MDTTDIKQQIRNNVKFESIYPQETGGQSCGIIYIRQRLICEELDLTIETGYHRSIFKNRDLLIKMLDSAIDSIID